MADHHRTGNDRATGEKNKESVCENIEGYTGYLYVVMRIRDADTDAAIRNRSGRFDRPDRFRKVERVMFIPHPVSSNPRISHPVSLVSTNQ